LFIDNAVNEQLKLINTGEDAISFFAKYGNSTPVKFIYCMRDTSVPSHIYRPYDLKVIKDGKNSKEYTLIEYYTISALGIVHLYTEKVMSFIKGKKVISGRQFY
jgi:dynein heavy chain